MHVARTLLVAGIAAIPLTAAPAFAHHSVALFDNEKNITLEGTVKEFQWTNPHIWVQLLVADPATGRDVEWSIEGGSPNGLIRQGWSPHSIKPGDRATVVAHPLKTGSAGAVLLSVTIDGKRVGSCTPESKAMGRCK